MSALRFAFLIILLGSSGARGQTPPPYQKVADLCVVPPERIAGLKPFRVRGVVTTWPDEAHESAVFTIHDGTAGIFVKAGRPGDGVEWRGTPGVLETIRVGSEIELEGVLTPAQTFFRRGTEYLLWGNEWTLA